MSKNTNRSASNKMKNNKRQLSEETQKKNLHHVPCKFFRQGACQAGDSCPFSHDTTGIEPCKYFVRGTCKFGNKCALPHVLPGEKEKEERSNSRKASVATNASSSSSRTWSSTSPSGFDSAIEDFDEADFLPSSLSDLLTPQELKRKNSRRVSSGSAKEELQFLWEESVKLGMSAGSHLDTVETRYY